MKLKIIINGGRVHGVGYRVMLVNKALSLGVSNFNVFNTFFKEAQAVFVVIEGDEEVVEEFKALVNTVKPDEAKVDNIFFESIRTWFHQSNDVCRHSRWNSGARAYQYS